jgi:seryl-tRNA synthetase
MHDIRAIRDNPKNFDAALKRRGIDTISNKIIEIDQKGVQKLLVLKQLWLNEMRLLN